MRDYYYLEAETYVEDGKRKFGRFNLFNHGEYIKTYTKEESKKIREKIKEYKTNIKKYNNKITIDDQSFINFITRLKLSQQKRSFNKKKMAGIIIALTLTSAGIMKSKSSLADTDDNNSNKEIIETKEDIKEYNNDTDNNIEIITTEENTNKKEQEPQIVETKNVSGTFEDIYSFDYEDRSNYDCVNDIKNKYGSIIDYYSNMYGIDSNLMVALICQENKNNEKNYSMIGGHGLTEIEDVWHNSVVYTYNFITNSMEASEPIDVLRATDDDEYSIKIGCMILKSYYDYIHSNFGNKLSKSEEIGATLFAYNKGITIISTALENTNNYDDFLNYVKQYSYGGDNEYIEHVLSYIEDEKTISIRNIDDEYNNTMIDNVGVKRK